MDKATLDDAKRACGRRAADLVQSGMKVGLGTGSTAAHLVQRLGERIRDEGLDIVAVPTSVQTAELAQQCGVPLVSLDQAGWLDLTIDGADEFDPAFNLIKGGGGALLREKIVASASDWMVVITDPSKEVERLGAFPLPVEVTPFGWTTTERQIEEALATLHQPVSRVDMRLAHGGPFETDERNHILDLHLGEIADAPALARALNAIPGVVETGLFVDICDLVVIGQPDGSAEIRNIHDTPRGGKPPLQGTEAIFSGR